MRLLALLFTVFLVPAIAWGQVPDYEIEDSEWAGLSEFAGVATAEGIQLERQTDLDYSKLDRDVPLVILYPTTQLDGDSLGEYVADGGRILLMDDFGQSELLLERLEVTRVIPSPGNLPHDEFLNGNPSLPVIRPTGRHPLLVDVEAIVGNHPAVVDNPGGAVVPYSAGGAMVYDMNLGDGKVVVVADASIAINKMVQVADNRQFLANALTYLCRNQPDCRIDLYTKSFSTTGRYKRSSMFDGGEDVSDTIDGINEAIEELMKHLPGEELLYYLSLLLCGGLVIYLLTIYPLRRTRPYSAYVTDFVDAVPAPQSEFDWNVSRFGRGSRTMNHALPTAILKETFEELFLDALDLWPSTTEDRQSIDHIISVFDERFLTGQPAATRKKILTETRELLVFLARVPTRSRVFLEGDVHVTDAELMKYHARATRVLKLMGRKDEYDNRVRGAF